MSPHTVVVRRSHASAGSHRAACELLLFKCWSVWSITFCDRHTHDDHAIMFIIVWVYDHNHMSCSVAVLAQAFLFQAFSQAVCLSYCCSRQVSFGCRIRVLGLASNSVFRSCPHGTCHQEGLRRQCRVGVQLQTQSVNDEGRRG